MIALAVVGALAFTLNAASASALGGASARQLSPVVSAVERALGALGPTTRATRQRQRPLGVSPLTASTAGNGLGNEPFYTYYSTHINDRKQLLVNVANGNLVVDATDLHVAGTGIDFLVESFYNSQSPDALDLGTGWSLGTGPDVRLDFNADGKGGITVHLPGGYAALFTSNGSGGWTDAPGVNASLTQNGDGTYALTFHKTGEAYTFSSGGHLSSDADKNGNLIYSTGSGNILTSFTDTQGRKYPLVYDGANRIDNISDPSGRVAKYSYNGDNQLATSTDLVGNITTFGYDPSSGMLTSVKDPRFHSTTIAYDSSGRVQSITDPTAQHGETTFAYGTGTGCPTGDNNTVVTDANGHATTYCYDPSTLEVKQVTDANGHMRSTSYTTNYDVAQLTDPLTNTTIFTYTADGKNNLNSVTDGNGAKTAFGYGDSGHPYYPTSQSDPQANNYSYTYDTAGNLKTSVNSLPSQDRLTYTYNSNGTVATVTDPKGYATTYGYDPKGNLTSVTPPTGSRLGTQTITYDGLSRVATFTDGKNQETSFTYDKLDRITLITYADSSTVAYTYDANGNVVKTVDRTGTTTFSYDEDNRQTQKTFPDSSTVSYSYDKVGNALTFADAGGTVTYTYDPANNLLTATDPNSAKTTFGYDHANQRTSVAYPNGVTMTLGYDKAGHETSVVSKKGSATLLSDAYSYTNPTTGKLTSLRYTMTDASGNVTTYDYDAINRLTSAVTKTRGGTQTANYAYAFDGNGNRTSFSESGLQSVSASYTYNSGNELTQSVVNSHTTTYSYDGNGNLTGASAGETLTYNAKNQTTAITPTTGAAALSYVYAGADQTQRTQAQYTASGKTYTLAFENTALGVSSQTASCSPSCGSPATTYYTRDTRGALISQRSSAGASATDYYLFDGNGSVVGLTDTSGTLVATYAYDPYGNVVNQTGSASSNWQFQSGYRDSGGYANGYVKFGARYDDPTLGRWTQQDPVGGSLGDTGATNRYVCVRDDPVNVSDPSGTVTTPQGACGRAAIIGAVGTAITGAVSGAIASIFFPPTLGVAVAVGFFGGLAAGFIGGCAAGLVGYDLPTW